MREFRLADFNNLEDASLWLENEFYELEVHNDFIKGEIVLIDGNYRCAVMVQERQMELSFENEQGI